MILKDRKKLDIHALKTGLLFAVFLLLIAGVWYSVADKSDQYPFVPVSMKHEKGEPVYFEAPELLNSHEYVLSLAKTLSGYGVTYELKNGIIYVEKSLYDDVEMRYNYTNKTGVD
jgi:hypothetical protein